MPLEASGSALLLLCLSKHVGPAHLVSVWWDCPVLSPPPIHSGQMVGRDWVQSHPLLQPQVGNCNKGHFKLLSSFDWCIMAQKCLFLFLLMREASGMTFSDLHARPTFDNRMAFPPRYPPWYRSAVAPFVLTCRPYQSAKTWACWVQSCSLRVVLRPHRGSQYTAKLELEIRCQLSLTTNLFAY